MIPERKKKWEKKEMRTKNGICYRRADKYLKENSYKTLKFSFLFS